MELRMLCRLILFDILQASLPLSADDWKLACSPASFTQDESLDETRHLSFSMDLGTNGYKYVLDSSITSSPISSERDEDYSSTGNNAVICAKSETFGRPPTFGATPSPGSIDFGRCIVLARLQLHIFVQRWIVGLGGLSTNQTWFVIVGKHMARTKTVC
ncbi:hypothetical protein MMC18_005638 [Xylographa bjoerkii]|nr:hypothetical protein [Xylographa bjoerkii]